MRELWRRREFAREMSRTNLRAQHFNTVFGQLWLVLNPLLLAGVYFMLVYILRSGSRGVDFFAHLLAGLFAYYFVSDAIRAVGEVGHRRRAADPQHRVPARAAAAARRVITAFMRFLPTLVIYIPVHIIAGLPVGLRAAVGRSR